MLERAVPRDEHAIFGSPGTVVDAAPAPKGWFLLKINITQAKAAVELPSLSAKPSWLPR